MNQKKDAMSIDQYISQYSSVDRAIKQRNYMGALGGLSYLPQEKDSEQSKTLEQLAYAHMAIQLAEAYQLGVDTPGGYHATDMPVEGIEAGFVLK